MAGRARQARIGARLSLSERAGTRFGFDRGVRAVGGVELRVRLHGRFSIARIRRRVVSSSIDAAIAGSVFCGVERAVHVFGGIRPRVEPAFLGGTPVVTPTRADSYCHDANGRYPKENRKPVRTQHSFRLSAFDETRDSHLFES